MVRKGKGIAGKEAKRNKGTEMGKSRRENAPGGKVRSYMRWSCCIITEGCKKQAIDLKSFG